MGKYSRFFWNEEREDGFDERADVFYVLSGF